MTAPPPKLLPVGQRGTPRFGPRVFDDAEQCPARAAVALNAWQLPTTTRSAPIDKSFTGAWPAASHLLRALAARGPTSTLLARPDFSQALASFAARVLRGHASPLRSFAATAVEALLTAQEATSDQQYDYLDEFVKVPFVGGELHAGGAFLFVGPGGRWQMWRLRTGRLPVGSLPPPSGDPWATTAAHVLVEYLDGAGRQLTDVTVYEASAETGISRQLGNWTREQVAPAFQAVHSDTLRPMAYDLAVRPGAHCAGCQFIGACPAAPRVADVLDGVPRQLAVRKISASDLQTHAFCARKYQLHSLWHLPGEAESGEALIRGQQIDTWLTEHHTDGQACSHADAAGLADEAADPVVLAMAGGHVDLCPAAEPRVSQLVAQPDYVVLDATSRVLLTARPDAAFVRDGDTVWRETKTRSAHTAWSSLALVEADLTAAVYLVVLEALTRGSAAVLEWEELTTAGPELTALFTDEAEVIEVARRRVSAAVADLLADGAFPPYIGHHCDSCSVNRWCPDAP